MTVCGEAASDPMLAPVLVGLGASRVVDDGADDPGRARVAGPGD